MTNTPWDTLELHTVMELQPTEATVEEDDKYKKVMVNHIRVDRKDAPKWGGEDNIEKDSKDPQYQWIRHTEKAEYAVCGLEIPSELEAIEEEDALSEVCSYDLLFRHYLSAIEHIAWLHINGFFLNPKREDNNPKAIDIVCPRCEELSEHYESELGMALLKVIKQ